MRTAFCKKIITVVLCIAALLTSVQSCLAQISNYRENTVQATDTIRIDSLSIMPGSLSVFFKGEKIDTDRFMVDELKSLLILRDSSLTDSLLLKYRVLPAYLGNDFYHKSTELISEAHSDNFRPFKLGDEQNKESIFNDNSLQKSGSISRGISFGNSQNLSVNSTLNLQLSGRITERFKLLASITDDNIPIQPDGNTQSLRDFDQVFIQIYDEKTRLIAGDFQVRKPFGYFMNYSKRAQGLYANSEMDFLNSKTNLKVEASASVSKGKFARNSIQGIEGNQGPYRLTGADNELYIIVLAGTEEVYIDGKLLQRGQDKDYVIDYNSAEITFTPRQFITKDKRIVVEFQYSDKRYVRPLIQSSVLVERDHDKFYLNIFSENDAKNQPLQQDLSDAERAILVAAGDDLLQAYTTGIEESAYNNSYVMYALTDSLGFDSVFVYSTDSVIAKYRLSFTFVGSGNGDYIEDGFTSNGKKFKWIAPEFVNGVWIRKGSYAPLRLLTAPKKNQMITAGVEKQFGKKKESNLQLEGALSHNDLNTFSGLDSGDDTGLAFRGIYNWSQSKTAIDTSSVESTFRKKNFLNAKLLYEYTGQNFSGIERYRDVEFNRDWNISNLQLTSDQHLAGGSFGFERKNFGSITLGGDVFTMGSGYEGYKARFNTNIRTQQKLTAQINASYLNTQGLQNSDFLRHKSEIAQELGKFRVYFKDEHEFNRLFVASRDSLSNASYQFYDWEVGAGTADTLRKSLTVYYRDRIDRRANDNLMHSTTRAEQYGTQLSFRGKKDNRLSLNFSNRKLRIIASELVQQEPENTLLTRVEYSFRIKNGFIANTSFYEVGSGLEQKREFIYLEVPAGQGNYIWNDYNGDGVKDLDEFEIAQFDYEANYIRYSVQSNDYVRSYTNQFSNSLVISPAHLLKKESGWQKLISRFSNTTSFRIERKTNNEEWADRFNPFLSGIEDSTLLSLAGQVRNMLFFNKANPKFGMDYTIQSAQNKNLLSTGFESRGDDYQQLGIRWNFYNAYTLSVDTREGKKANISDFMAGRNYEIQYYSIEPKISRQASSASRLNATAQYSQKNNLKGNETATIQKLGADLTLSKMEKGSVQFELNYFRIRYNGEGNNSLSFDMLEGLSNGNNFTWSAGIQRTLAKNLQINLMYNGRKPESLKAIHSGSIQVRALF